MCLKASAKNLQWKCFDRDELPSQNVIQEQILITINGVRVRDNTAAQQQPKRHFDNFRNKSLSRHFTSGLFWWTGNDGGGVLGYTTLRGNPMCTAWLFLHMTFSLAPHML